MLSLFPELFDFSLVAVTLLRVVAGWFFLYLGMRLVRAAWGVRNRGAHIWLLGALYGLAHTVIGAFLFVGLMTQLAAGAGALLAILTYTVNTSHERTRGDRQVQFLLAVICVSLIFLGPGLMAVDLPL
jgi:uncharacterized membrane protein YphA (DoxX/SURF4 family)